MKGIIVGMKQLTAKHQVWVQVSVNPPSNRCISPDQVIKYIDSIEDGSDSAPDVLVIFYNQGGAFDSQCSLKRTEALKQVISHYRP